MITTELSENVLKDFETSPIFRLWDRPSVLWERASSSRVSAETLKQFLTDLSIIENNFSSALSTLVEKFDLLTIQNEGPSLIAGWKILLNQIRDYGSEFAELSKSSLEVANGSELTQASSLLDAPVKQFQENIEAAKRSFDAKSDVLTQAELNKQPDAEIQRARAEKQQAEESVSATTLNALVAYQDLEYERLGQLREALSQVVSKHGVCLQPLVKSALQATRNVRAISPKEDLEALSDAKSSGLPCSWKSAAAADSTAAGDVNSATAAPTTPTAAATAATSTEAAVTSTAAAATTADTAAPAAASAPAASTTATATTTATTATSPPPPPPAKSNHGSKTISKKRAKGIKLNNNKHNNSYATMRLARGTLRFTEMKATTPTGTSSRSREVDDDADEAFEAAMKFATLKKAAKAKAAIEKANVEKEQVEKKDNAETEKEKPIDTEKAKPAETATEAPAEAEKTKPAETEKANPAEKEKLPEEEKTKSESATVAKDAPKEPKSASTEDEADEAFAAAMKFAAAKKAEKKNSESSSTETSKSQPATIKIAPASSEAAENYYNKHASKAPPPPAILVAPTTPRDVGSQTPSAGAAPKDLLSPSDVTRASVASERYSQDTRSSSSQSFRVPIIVDNGSGSFKAGLAGDLQPSLVVPSAVACYPKNEYKQSGGPLAHMVGSSALHIGPQLCEAPSSVSVNEMLFSDNPQWDDVELAWEYLLSRLSDDYAEHPILMTQPCMAPLKLKSVMQEILYEKFGVRELFVAEAPLLSAYAYGHSTGLVVEVGHSSAQIVPCVDGYVLSAHVQRVKHFGGWADTKRVVQYFRDHTDPKDPLELNKYSTSAHLHLMAESLKDRLCVCPSSKVAYDDEYTVMDEVKGFLGGRSPDDEANAPKRPHSVTLHRALLACGETCFSPQAILEDEDASIVSIQQLCANVVAKCDVDTRNALLSNVFLSGQVTTMPGFDDRLLRELKATVPHASNIRVYGEARRYAPWIGGSVLASLDEFASEWRTKEDWEGDR